MGSCQIIFNINLIDDKTALGANNQSFQGNYNAQINTITLNLANISNLNDFTNTLGHELSHAIMANQNKFIPQDIKQNDYANLKGRIFTDYLNKALDLEGYDIDLSKSNVNLDFSNPSNINALINNQIYFNSMDKTQSDNADINNLNPENKNGIAKIPEIMSKSAMDDYNPTNRIVYVDHGGLDDKGAYIISYADKNAKDTAKSLQKEFSDLDKYKNNPTMPIELSVCNIGGSYIQKELSLLEPNREIIAYEGYYATQLVYTMPYLNPGSGKIIYKNGKVIYRDKDTSFVDKLLNKKLER